MSKYGSAEYICMVKVINPTVVESEVKVSLRPHGPHGRMFQAMENMLELWRRLIILFKMAHSSKV